jgi:hypothetical protein
VHLINANELINSGVRFQMVNEDAGFDDNGELIGYTEVAKAEPEWETNPDLAGDHRNRYFSSSEGLADTTELCTPYWQEVADAHVAEMQHAEWLATPTARDAEPLHGTMEFWAAQRTARADRLVRFAQRLRKDGKLAKLATLKRGVRERHVAAVKLVVGRGKNEWFLLYLTKEQYNAILSV